jgi:dihydrofolate synthase/folylpolyglutamate synthase
MQTFAAVQVFDEALGFPHRAFCSIHIGGTNGKGSVATKIAAALQRQGYKVGLYTSPHIFTFHERIQVNGTLISEEAIERILPRLFSLAEERNLSLSFFDLATALGFVYFVEQKVDFAVIEVGLGGRLDATNVIHPLLSVITSIDLEHTQLLGKTLEEVAREKGGIIKPGAPLIAGPRAAPFFSGSIAAPDPQGRFYDEENRATARAALEKLQELVPLSDEAIAEGLKKRPLCRFQVEGDVIFDAAHNPAAFVRLKEALELHFPARRFPFYLAFSKEKDWKACLEVIAPLASQMTFVRLVGERFVAPEVLSDAYPGSQIVEALPKPVKEGVVCGSFYLMSTAR